MRAVAQSVGARYRAWSRARKPRPTRAMATAMRELTAFEGTFALPWHRKEEKALPMNVFVAAEVKMGEGTSDRFVEAAKKVQARHPLLGCSIGRAPPAGGEALGALALLETGVEIPVEVRKSSLSVAELEAANAECLNWVDTAPNAPVAKVLALQGADERWVLYFLMTHVLFDGRSAQTFASEFLELLAEPAAALPPFDPALERLTLRAMIDAEGVKSEDGFGAYAGEVFSKRANAGLSGADADFEAQTGTASLFIPLDADQTAALVASAKSSGTSVNTVLLAAWARATAAYAPFRMPADATGMVCGGPIDVRPALGDKYARALSQIFGPLFMMMPLDKPHAEQYAHIDAVFKKFKETLWHATPFAREKGEKDAPKRWADTPLAELCTSFPKEACSFSNLGRIEYPSSDRLPVVRTWLCGGAYPDINMICHGATTAGVCTLTIQYVTPAHKREDIEALALAFKKEFGAA